MEVLNFNNIQSGEKITERQIFNRTAVSRQLYTILYIGMSRRREVLTKTRDAHSDSVLFMFRGDCTAYRQYILHTCFFHLW